MLLGELAVTLRESASADEALRQKDAKITELQQTLGRREHEVGEVKKHLQDVDAEVWRRVFGWLFSFSRVGHAFEVVASPGRHVTIVEVHCFSVTPLPKVAFGWLADLAGLANIDNEEEATAKRLAFH